MRNLRSKVLSGRAFQAWHERVLRSALHYMNYGRAGEIEWSGELNVMKHLLTSRRAGEDLIVFDVGANVGNYSRRVLETDTKRGGVTIYSFEPDPETFEVLRKNLAKFPVKLFNLGLSDRVEERTLWTSPNISELGSFYEREIRHHNIELSRSRRVKATSLDKFLSENGISRIDLLKLDVEGHELSVLRGAANALSGGKISRIQWEMGGCNIDSRTFFRDFWLLLSEKYHIYRVLQNGLAPITRYSEEQEIFITVNYYAELKSL